MIDTKIAQNLIIDVCGSVFKNMTCNSLYATKIFYKI